MILEHILVIIAAAVTGAFMGLVFFLGARAHPAGILVMAAALVAIFCLFEALDRGRPRR